MVHYLILYPFASSNSLGEAVPCCSLYGRGTDAVHIQNVGCSGTEVNITSCRNDSISVPQSHDYDVGVRCQQGLYTRSLDVKHHGVSLHELYASLTTNI